MSILLYFLFFLSGSAALIYEVAWTRSLGLVFGASHLAVTTVLAVFMAGLALGSRAFGRRADAARRPLRLYALLELGVGACALLFLLLSRFQHHLYAPLARLGENSPVYLTALRVAFAAIALIGPTVLMGGTLPVLSRLVAGRPERLGRQLSLLYGLNTLGAVAGALACGFVLLRQLGVTGTILTAAAINGVVGAIALLLPERLFEEGAASPAAQATPALEPAPRTSSMLVLLGIGIGGFCALGYEVLWTRMLTLVVGTSVYSFAIILVAFLGGIALGGESCALLLRWLGTRARRALLAFGVIEALIGISALGVTVLMRGLPSQAVRLQEVLARAGHSEFAARQGASLAVALAYVFLPAFLGGLAFPLAAAIYASGRRVGASVGEVLSVNTLGAILGSAVSGYLLIDRFGVERSLQMLAVLNVAAGCAVLASLSRRRILLSAVAGTAAALLVARATDTGWGRAWDLKSFALFTNNARYADSTPFQQQDARDDTDVVYYFEGANEIISVIHPHGAWQSFIVNGRPEASTAPMDMQCQRTLGHLPMLAHPRPRRVFVLGTGTGMTLGAVTLHPEVESIVLAEIEPGAIAAGRSFAEFNHHALDDPRLRVVFNDGRNYLDTSLEKFDVITADPIHPWSGGAAYLYTDEYFRTVAERLAPGGVAAQWLPLYELSVRDVKTVVRTFAANFRFVMVWVTSYDAELLGSNDPIVLDQQDLARRIAVPAVARDLAEVQMGSAEDFLSYFALGDRGARAFAEGGMVNTDDNLWLEFSAPQSMGVGRATGDNMAALALARESIVPYLAPAGEAQLARWQRIEAAVPAYDAAHALHELGGTGEPQFRDALGRIRRELPSYAPLHFLERQLTLEALAVPLLMRQAGFAVRAAAGPHQLQISAVVAAVSELRRALIFVDNEKRDIYGQRYFDGPSKGADPAMALFATEVLGEASKQYQQAVVEAAARGERLPPDQATADRLRRVIAARTAGR